MMICTVSVGSKTVVLDGVARWCMNLAPPEPWAQAYAYDDLAKGMIQPYPQAQMEPEFFDDPARMQFAIDAWEASPPPPLPPMPPEPEPIPPIDP